MLENKKKSGLNLNKKGGFNFYWIYGILAIINLSPADIYNVEFFLSGLVR